MATNRYYCEKCDYIVEFDSRRTKNLLCPICSSDLTFSRFWGGVAGKKLYGRCDYDAKSYIVPDGVKIIEDSFFLFCSKLESVTLPSTLEAIPKECFYGCTGLTHISIPDSVQSIGISAFRGCEALASITLPNSITEISIGAFQNCTRLARVVFPSAVTEIGYDAFSGCKALTSIFLPEGVTKIGADAFWGCDNITVIRFGKAVKTIGKNAFHASKIKRVYLPSSVENSYLDSSLPFISIKKSERGAAVSDDIIISEGTETIPAHAFERKDIKTVYLPDSVKEIGEYAFAYCKGIKIVRMSSNLSIVGKCAFNNCEIDSIDLPGSVVVLAPDAFDQDTKVTIKGVNAEKKLKLLEIKKANSEEESLIIEAEQAIEGNRLRVHEYDAKISEIESQIREKKVLLTNEQTKIPDYEKKHNDAKEKRDEAAADLKIAISPLESALTRLEGEKKQLEQQLQDTFFLNFSKKNSLSQTIESKNQEIDVLGNRIHEEKARAEATLFTLEKDVSSAEKSKNEHMEKCQGIERDILTLKKTRNSLSEEKATLDAEGTDLKNNLEKLKDTHQKRSALRKRQLKAIEQKETDRKAKEQQKMLLSQKEKIVHDLRSALDKVFIAPIMIPQQKQSTPDELLLNESFETLIITENNRQIANALKNSSSELHKKVNTLKSINLSLDLDENDGLDSRLMNESSVSTWTKKDFPKRIDSLCIYFGEHSEWIKLKELIQNKQHVWQDDLHKRFFSYVDCALISCENTTSLVFLPFCVVVFNTKSDMRQMFYDTLHANLEVKEFESTEIQKDCEEIGNRYLHENKDGSRNMRYSENPLIHQWRKSTVLIKYGSRKFSIPFTKKREADEFKDTIDAYIALLVSPQYKNCYKAVKQFKDVDEVKSIFNSSEERLTKKIEREKAKEAAEHKAAEVEAAEKRKKLIEKQRERNAERRFHDISASQPDVSEEVLTWQSSYSEEKVEASNIATASYPIVIDLLEKANPDYSEHPGKGLLLASKSRIVHNNIFSLDFLFRVNAGAVKQTQSRSVFMSDSRGNPISEISTLQVNDNEKYHLTITLSQNSFSKKEKYYLVVVNDAQGSVESLTEFKIDIAFSNDFDDFGF